VSADGEQRSRRKFDSFAIISNAKNNICQRQVEKLSAGKELTTRGIQL